ncbi:adenylate/guanylate cyclase domain-containing protein [Sulfitobacter sp. D35]|uniref:adenylate/guanylate cyclase domain-containing protein n=1 Tax=Sulfitobacter sp. D35 TaxID=3083252 RepID=UPI00296F3AED|nr:adenylate/guanylate cyclase domain-containing protein [Sulfitobacter sp. D35]MDW4498513.1 adenylate/guanylate cyclase domain-containing protein [Sulfitobacter sp. D35]
MSEADRISREALAARIAQRLAGPAETILGYQALIVDTLGASEAGDALEDAEVVLKAARALNDKIARLVDPEADLDPSDLEDATLRHDLRTPVNAILGYSELILEEQGDAIDATVRSDIETVVTACGHVLEQIDGLVGFSRGSAEALAADAADAGIAEALARTLSDEVAAGPGISGRILVIDDVEANRELLRRHLTTRGHSVTTAASAREALKLLKASNYELALVDILMPDMNGIELLATLKSNPLWREMAVVMVSGLKDVQAIVKCIKAGAADYLPKPVDPVLLHARVESCLETVRWRERERRFVEKIAYEKSRADGLLLSMLPATIIERVGRGETVIADRFEAASIIFADIVDFTPLVARTDPTTLVGHLHALFSQIDELADRHGVEKIKTIGDAYMAVVGVPEAREDHADRAIAFGRALLGLQSEIFGASEPLRIRVGVSSGPVIAGLIGRKRFVYDVWGETVNLASRLEASGEAGRIHTSTATIEALSATPQSTRQQTAIKGVGRIETFLIA